jgi:ElaB/YqjD/DUF883 family membrane-anchored ribosome-binding protein
MIKNTVVANVKAGGSDQELRALLTEYERRLRDMESDRNDSSEKLRQIIENLMREKDELAERLLKANHLKLTTNAAASAASAAVVGLEVDAVDVPDEVGKEGEPMTAVYIWGVGMLHSSQPIDKAIPPRTS